MTLTMKTYALIGRRLGHSYSARWFADLFAYLGLADHRYVAAEMESLDGLRQWVQREGICGMNVTVPYKQAVIAHLDALDAEAEAIGAVNCVTVEHTAGAIRLVGHNTDAPAFHDILPPLDRGGRAVVLGTGGAARAVGHALRSMGIEVVYVSRQPEAHHDLATAAYDDLPALLSAGDAACSLLVNATPVGMYPNADRSPVEERLWPADCRHLTAYDLVYNPSPTLFMRQAAARSAQTCDGLAMLHRQAELSWLLFHPVA